jgi:CxxC motif-containing protein (DUF1111 family)
MDTSSIRQAFIIILILIISMYGCDASEDEYLARFDPSERFPGGETTNTRLLGSNAYLMPATNLSPEIELAFYGGNGFFNQGWVEAPASTDARDGLGPLFNARSCSGCHFKDGKGEPPEEGDRHLVGLLLRIQSWTGESLIDDAIYGGQLQDQAIPNVSSEAKIDVRWNEKEGSYSDGSTYQLRWPSFSLSQFSHGEPQKHLVLSPRLAPHMIGLGLLEAIKLEDLAVNSDPNDENNNGISGRISWVMTADGLQQGRFGWRAEEATVRSQVAGAFAGDMGLTTTLIPQDTCTGIQSDCLNAEVGGEPEVSDHIFDRVVIYSKTVAVPVRRIPEDPVILSGKALFNKIDCSLCHTPSYVTGSSDIPALSGQRIWPYTDLLLHDMGSDLSDQNPGSKAIHQEWRTAPLWGIGLAKQVTSYTGYLHDGRARTIEEAILWHGGEAKDSRDSFMMLSQRERKALIAFVSDL